MAFNIGRRHADTDTRYWGLSRRSALLIALAPLVVAGSVAVLAVLAVLAKSSFRPAFRFVTAEDSLLEWPQFLFVFASSLIFAFNSLQLLRRGQRLAALMYAALALGALFVAGEEISWGQRIFGWGTPEALDTINHQGETNVHNIRLVQRLFGYVVLVGSAYGTIAPILRARYWQRFEHSQLASLFIPPLCLVPTFLMPFAYRLIHTFVWTSTNFTVVKYGEAPELCMYFGMFVFAWLNMRRLQQADTATVSKPAHMRPMASADRG
jgi:hypothetical protein